MQLDDIVLTVDSVEYGGKGVARKDGKVYFVNGGVTGDVVKCKIKKSKKSYSEVDIIEILKPSDKRVVPKCKYFSICGGCALQHISYKSQLEYKQQAIADALKHIGGFTETKILPIIGSDDIFYYRNKMEFTFSNKRWIIKDNYEDHNELTGEFGLGLHVPKRFDKVLDINTCLLQIETFDKILNLTRTFVSENSLSIYSTKTHTGYLRHLMLRRSVYSGEIMVNLVTSYSNKEFMKRYTDYVLKEIPEVTTVVNNITARKSMVAVGEEEEIYYGNGYILEKLGNYLFKISANSFFQTNTKQAEKLYNIVKEYSNFKPTDIVYDLYSGTGSIAIYISEDVRKIIGIELNESAVNDARKNVELNSIKNCIFVQGDLKEILSGKDFKASDLKPDVVILDPPRSGVHPNVLNVIAQIQPRTISYVSCNPTTMSRDLKILAGKEYEIVNIQPIDMFPQTYHLEAVAILERFN